MPRAYWQSADTQQRADALAFTSQANNEVATLGFSTNAASDIDGLGDHLKLADPLPVVVSDRPDAMTIRQNQQAAAPTESRASTTSSGAGAAGAQPPAVGGGTAAAMPSGGGWSGGPTPSGGGKADRYAAQIAQVSQEEGVPYDVLAALYDTEDSDPAAVSAAGARGPMQVVPGQGYDRPGEDPTDIVTSLRQGARAIKDKFKATGSWEQAGRAYFGYGTDAGGMTTDRYGQIYDANRARYQGGAPQPASSQPAPQQAAPQQAAPAPSMPSEATAAAPSPVGGEVTVRHRGTGALTTMPADQWQYVADKSSYDIVSGPDQYKAIDAQATDDPGGMSAGDQKRAKLAALSSSPQPMPGSQGPYDNGPAPLPGATAPQTAPSAAPETDADGLPILPGTRILPGPPQGVSSDQMPNDPVIQDQRVNQQMYRLPIGAPTQGADTATGEDYDPRDADQGAHEQTTPPSTPDDASGFAPPTTYAGGGDDAGAPTPTAPASYGTAGDDPGQAPTPAPVQPAPSDEQPGAVQQAISWAGGKLKPVLNAAGEVVAYVHDTAQGAFADPTVGQVTSTPGEPDYVRATPRSTVQQATDWVSDRLSTPIQAPAPQSPEIAQDDPPRPSEMTMAQRERIRQGDALSQDETDAILARRREHTTLSPQDEARALPYQAGEATRQSIQEAAQSFADAVRAGQEGRPLAAAGNALWGALQAAGLPFTTVARTIDAILPEMNIAGVGPGDAITSMDLLRDGINGVNTLKNGKLGDVLSPDNLARADAAVSEVGQSIGRGARALGEEGARQLMDMTPQARVVQSAESDIPVMRGYGARSADDVVDAAGRPTRNDLGVVFGTQNLDMANQYADGKGSASGVLHYVVRRGGRVADISDPETALQLVDEAARRAPSRAGQFPGTTWFTRDELSDPTVRQQIAQEIANAGQNPTDSNLAQLAVFDDPVFIGAARRLGWDAVTDGETWTVVNRRVLGPTPTESTSFGSRIRGAVAANAERVSAADARMAEQGSTVAPGTLGVVSGNPLEANAAAGTRVVPPHVSDTLDFPVRVPTDPGVVKAIEAAGGSVDPERGVNLNVIRYQGPEAHGKPSTRSSTFYTADKPGAPSPYATANNGGNGVGGSDRIEAPTTYRSPLVLDEPPGSMRGFNRAMDQLGVTAADGSQVLSADIDQGIAAARRAGPPGSPERAQALKDLVSNYGGDPAAIDDLLAVRGADDSESAWAIKENILAHNARAKGYDGVLTVQHVDPPTSDLLAHPDVVAASKAEKDAQVAVMRADRRRSDAQGRGADWQELNQLDAEKDNASSAWLDTQQARMAAIEKAKQELGGGKITELADFRESHNPTPGAFTEPFDQIRIETTPRGFYRVAEYDARGNFAGYVSGEYRTQDLAESARTRYIDQEWHGQRADPGYTLRSDLPRRGGTTEAASRPGIAASGRVLTDVSNSIGGGVFGAASGAALPADSDEDRRRNALIGAGAGMLAGPVAGRLMRHGEGGALATFGASPNYRPPTPKQVQSAAQQGAQRGRRLNQIVKAPASDVPLAVRAATGATDDRAGLRWAEDMLSDAAGNPRMRENDPARPSTQSRVNAGGVAAERIASDLEPAITQAGRAGLQDDLPRYLEDMHARDIMDAFYTREKQKVLDDRAQKIAASQSRGASPNVIARMQAKAQTDAEAAGTRAVRKRQGSNPEHTYEATDARLQEQEQRLKADGRWQGLQDAAQAVWDHNAETRDRLVMSGNLDPQVAADLAQTYPHYVPTVPVSHLTEGAGPVASSSNAVSRGTRASVSALDDVGTSGDRLNPIVASRDSTVRAERDIQRNTVAHAFAQMMDDALQASPGTMATSAATHRTFLGGGTDVHYFENGERQTLNVPKSVANGIEAAADMGMSGNAAGRLWRTAMGAVTSAMTAGRASFLPVNLARDAQDYAIRTAAKEGGPHKLPGVVGTWISEASKAVADVARAQLTGRSVAGAAIGSAAGAAQGDDQTTIGERARHAVEGGVAGAFLLGANKVGATGKAAEYLARGGGSGGLSAHWTSGQRWYRDVQRGGGVPIKSAGDAAHYLGDWLHDIATLQGVKGINERTELISRTAAMTRADKQGLAPVESMIRGRDASYDPDRSGTMARVLNGWIPFFNASVQNSAQFGRLLKQNPVAAGTTLVATVAPVMLAAEAWNRSDPTRAQVYDDIPQYIKDSGIVAVLPWAGSDNRGSRPNYLWVPTGVQTPFITGMRKAMEKLPGLEPTEGRGNEDWAGTLGSVLGMFSPVRGDSVGAAMSNLVPQIAKQGVELGVNRDLYRGNPIETDTADERASAASRAVAGGANAVGRAVGSDWLQEVRPSGVEHIMQALPAYGDLVSGASDMIAPSGYKQGEDRPVQNEPFVGGIAGRFLRDTGGANLQRAQDDKLPQNVRDVFESAGMRPSDMGTVPGSYKNAPLTREEQERWQTTTNQVMAQQIAQVRRDPKWRDPSTREQAVRDAMAAARELAAQRALRNLTDREIDRRKRADQAMKAAN